jgi:hypothetical protein
VQIKTLDLEGPDKKPAGQPTRDYQAEKVCCLDWM